MRLKSASVPTFLLLTVMACTTQASLGQTAAAAAAPVVPNLIRFNGVLTDGRGYPVTAPVDVTFSLYAEQSSGQGESKGALWHETQRVSPDEKGAYTIYLGAATAKGLPSEAFASVTAQWLGVKIESEPELPRVLLVSVPYALKAGDSQTLGGLPASAFALAGSRSGAVEGVVPESAGATAISSDTVSNVTTTGGTSGYVPLFNGTNTVVNSVIYNTGAQVGIGRVPTAGAILDVNGAMVMRGRMTVSRTGDATASQGYPSYGFDFFSNAYNSSKKTTANPYFELKSEPTGNNTSNPSATLNLLFANNGTIGETGFYVNPNGQVHFASGQTFPGTGTGNGTITGVTASTGLSGGGTSGTVTLKNTGILAVGAGTGIKSTGGQSPTLSVNSAVVPYLANENFFTTNQIIDPGFLEAVNTTNTALYAFNNSTNSTSPALYVENDDSTSAGDLAFEVYGGNTGASCTIDVTGNLFCTGSLGPALKKANNTAVSMYTVTSAENWVEDFGTAKLVNGVAVVHINPDLAEAVSADASYHVFPTPNGDCAGLYVTNRTATSFEVRELKGGTSNIEFDYRVVAHRKGFETVRMPDITKRLQARPQRPGLNNISEVR